MSQSNSKSFNIGGTLTTVNFPAVMGVINVTPDSFYEGSRYESERLIIEGASEMIQSGAAIIDVGGHSTRPGAKALTTAEELNRAIPVIRLLRQHFDDVLISIDTFQSDVAQAAIDAGASMINDISGGQFDPQIHQVAAKNKVPYILGHLQGTFDTMMKETAYDDLLSNVYDYFIEKRNQLTDLGVYDIIVDPCFGFSKTVEQNYQLLKNMGYFTNLGMPVLAGLSRKSMIWKLLEIQPEEALNGTTVLNTLALINGASILRVHDVKQAIETVKLFNMTYA